MNKSDPIFLNLWARVEADENPVVRVANWFKSNGWTVTSALCCDAATSSRDETAILDLPCSERIICPYDTAGRWAIEVELTRLRHGKTGKRENRKVRFGRSSVPCPWIEHAVEIEISTDAKMWATDRETRQGYARIIEELRRVSEAIAPCWVLLGAHGRGPSLPELNASASASSFMLSTVFLSDAEFDESTVERIATGARIERWPNGWLLSSSRSLDAPTGNSSSFTNQVWSCLREWGSRAARGRS
jgi:hypothetical protein